MQRLTARLLLLFALAGSFAPLAMQALAAPTHACCRRKAAHQCHGSAELEGRVVRNKSCCQQNCSRGVTTSRFARPNAQASNHFTAHVDFHELRFCAAVPYYSGFASRSPRAPPQASIA
jgi:hypothetical protein